MKKLFFSIISLLCVLMLTACSSSSKARSAADDFMKYLKAEDYNGLDRVTSTHSVYSDMMPINVFDYSRKSVSDEYKVKHVITVERIKTNDPDNNFDYKDMYENQKNAYKNKYPDYEIVTDTADEFVIQSKDRILNEYTVVYDVSYSNVFGNEKRSSLTLTITQKEPKSDTYLVTDVYGIY